MNGWFSSEFQRISWSANNWNAPCVLLTKSTHTKSEMGTFSFIFRLSPCNPSTDWQCATPQCSRPLSGTDLEHCPPSGAAVAASFCPFFFPLPAVAEERREEIVGFWNILVHGAWNTRIKTTPGPMIIPGPGDRVTFRHTTFSYFVLFKGTFFSSAFKSINLIQFDFCLNKNLPFYENCSEMI